MNRVRPRLARAWRGGERQRADRDVGVLVLVVGVGVVTVVLVDPPAVAQPDGQVAVQQADHVVGPPGPEDLPVPGVVADEPELGEHERQEPATNSCHHESPTRTKTAQPPTKSSCP